jgi:hypothetical protein
VPTVQSPTTQLCNPTRTDEASEATDAVCGVTVLRTGHDRCATKTWRWNPKLGEWTVRAYNAGTWFVPREHHVRNLHELANVLEEVRRDPRAFVVRGALAQHAREALARNPDFKIRRRKHPKRGDTPALVEVRDSG